MDSDASSSESHPWMDSSARGAASHPEDLDQRYARLHGAMETYNIAELTIENSKSGLSGSSTSSRSEVSPSLHTVREASASRSTRKART
jgi:hypothetical protein